MKRKKMHLKVLNLCNTGLSCEVGDKTNKYNFMFFCKYLLVPYVPLIDLNLRENPHFGDEGAKMLFKTLGKIYAYMCE
jgi:hypothetical protein